MKEVFIYNINGLLNKIFIATFKNLNTKEILSCYSNGLERKNLNILVSLINNCVLIGYENIEYDDIILNYIKHNKQVDINELYELSNAIINYKSEYSNLYKNNDISFYMYKYIDSIDFSKIKNISFDKFSKNIAIDNLLIDNETLVESLYDEIENFKKAQNYGFRKNYNNIPNSEDMFINYINNRIGLTNNEI